ncbi:MAG: hypothetical protein SP1CHLAM54_11260 [Chlamydiia bacterium]|nr:hypothetical protein [Chlamydiia bacterium]MCH9616029.1 hypothetical protein [Chlamydiia bacterium]MCH9629052.1 hypothetical protein [Chlamydiia bacterium]
MAIIPIILYLTAWVLAIISTYTGEGNFPYELVRYLLLLSVGVQGIWSFIGHFFYSKDTAKHVGWQSGPFQHEIAFCNLSYGVLGVLGYWLQGVWFATTLGITIFLLGAAYIHVMDMVKKKNFSPGNAGPIFYLDILIPLTLWIAIWVHFA